MNAPVSAHTFHIPVMGTGFMIDAPLKVARYGISSVLSLVDDVLVEQMRQYHCQREGEEYVEIKANEEDVRARRITAYLDLLGRVVDRQVRELQASPFEPGSEITRYYDLLPDCPLKAEYQAMLGMDPGPQRAAAEERLRRQAVPGGIDVNIMSKGDREYYRDGEKLDARYSDASAALRGYANSTLASSIIFSAGLNPRLYSYVASFADFFPDADGGLKKRIVLKVSDYHSAAVQGKFFAKRGLWVSEYRIESGLNCGGHAFATKGHLLGPILQEFKDKRQALADELHEQYVKALTRLGRAAVAGPLPLWVTVQGGIGTAEEDRLLREHYGADRTGWGTPFLLVPEVTNVDEEHLKKLCEAGDDQVYLSDSSPFGLPFWNLRNSASEEARRRRIAEGRPGSPCTKGYAKLYNTEFTAAPICTASRQYQRLKLKEVAEAEMSEERRQALTESVLAKSCICHDLAGGATLRHGIDPDAHPAVCCGPNIVNFNRVATLDEMVGHIYGRLSLLATSDRPHMFVRELAIYVEYLREELKRRGQGLSTATPQYFREFVDNLYGGIDHYRRLAKGFLGSAWERFVDEINALDGTLKNLAAAVPA